MPAQGWSGVARYGVPGVLLGLALMGGTGGGRGPVAQAQNLPGAERARTAQAAGGDASGTIAFTAAHGGMVQLLYLIDTKNHAFAIYRVDPSNPEGAVKLEAARQYQWDLKLLEYNNQKPEVASVEASIKPLGHTSR
jgi:hypothetical protein